VIEIGVALLPRLQFGDRAIELRSQLEPRDTRRRRQPLVVEEVDAKQLDARRAILVPRKTNELAEIEIDVRCIELAVEVLLHERHGTRHLRLALGRQEIARRDEIRRQASLGRTFEIGRLADDADEAEQMRALGLGRDPIVVRTLFVTLEFFGLHALNLAERGDDVNGQSKVRHRNIASQILYRCHPYALLQR